MTDAIQKAREALVAAKTALEYSINSLDGVVGLYEEDEAPDGGSIACQSCIKIDRKAIAKIDAALAALDAETEVKIRPLEWVDNSGEEYAIRHDGRCGDFHYVARAVRTGDMILAAGRYHASIEAAKAFVQADFERRIRSALVTPEARS